MRIAIDARELSGRPTGVGRYLSELLSAWGRLPAAAAHEFVLCAAEPLHLAGTPPSTEVRVASGRGTWWQQLVLPRLVRSANADLLFAPAYTGPLAVSRPMVVFIHDLSFVVHPEWFGAREGLRLRTLTRLSARRAAHILTCSHFSRREILRCLGTHPGKVDVVYHGRPGITASPAAAGAAAGRHSSAGSERLVLYAGSIFERRHVAEIVAAFTRLAARRRDARLAIVGDNRSPLALDRMIAASGAADRILASSYVPDAELAALYARASAFVFLSDYEGFGLTPLEALGAGVPIVVLDTEVSREIYGAAAIHVARPEPALIEEALERAVWDEAARARVLAAAPEVLARYSWDACAARTLDVLTASAR